MKYDVDKNSKFTIPRYSTEYGFMFWNFNHPINRNENPVNACHSFVTICQCKIDRYENSVNIYTVYCVTLCQT